MHWYRNLCCAGWSGLLVLAAPPAALAGPTWDELMVDAGSLPENAQTTFGEGSLDLINGALTGFAAGAAGPADFEDMYLIYVDDPNAFRATTDPRDPELPNGTSTFDTQLWLFRPSPFDLLQAFGRLGNNDHPASNVGSPQSLLVPLPSDGGPPITEPGLYYLAISGATNDPLSSGALPIFNLASPTEISSADGLGGPVAISNWSSPAVAPFGDYSIALRGVRLVSTCPWDCSGDFDRMVGAADFLALLAEWGTPGNCDTDGSGNVDTVDFLDLLAHWGPCPVAENDECPEAAQIRRPNNVGLHEIPIDLAPATPSPDPFDCASASHKDIWFCLHNESGVQKRVEVSTSIALLIEVYDGCECPPGPLVSCGSPNAPIFFLDPGNSVMIRLVNDLDLPNHALAGVLMIENLPIKE